MMIPILKFITLTFLIATLSSNANENCELFADIDAPDIADAKNTTTLKIRH